MTQTAVNRTTVQSVTTRCSSMLERIAAIVQRPNWQRNRSLKTELSDLLHKLPFPLILDHIVADDTAIISAVQGTPEILKQVHQAHCRGFTGLTPRLDFSSITDRR